MNTGTTIMIHEASTFAFGNKTDIQKTLNALETIDDSLVAIYAERTGIGTDEIKDLLNAETWFTAEEAVNKGFADEVKAKAKEKQEDETEEEKVENSININVDAKLISGRLDNLEKMIKDAIQNKQAEEPVAKPRNLMSKLRGGL